MHLSVLYFRGKLVFLDDSSLVAFSLDYTQVVQDINLFSTSIAMWGGIIYMKIYVDI